MRSIATPPIGAGAVNLSPPRTGSLKYTSSAVASICARSNGFSRLLIGVACLIGGLFVVARKWRRGDGAASRIAPLFLIVWSLAWLYLHDFPHVFGHINKLLNGYEEKKYQVVEGLVEVLHQQPATGHAKGDIVVVNGKQFEVNYFYATPAYHNTLAHGGVLGRDVYARIYYYNGEILRIDIRER